MYDPQSGQPPLTRGDLKIPPLDEYIRICRCYQKQAVLELKNPMTKTAIAAIVEEIKRWNYLEQTTFISFCFENLVAVREVCPNGSIQFLTGGWEDDLLDRLAEFCMGLDIHHSLLTAERVALAHEKGIWVNCWTVDDPQRAEELIGYGVDYITSNILE